MRPRWLMAAALVAAAGCGRRSERPGAPPADGAPALEPLMATPVAAAAPLDELTCEKLPFAETIPISEASGAVWLARAGTRAGVVMVVGDSGNDGAYLVLDGDDGRVLERGELPLGSGNDDLEGLSTDGELIWALTSGGWMRAWRAMPGGGFELAVSPYAISDQSCNVVNCGRNFEGLCLVAGGGTIHGCHGFGAAKATGELVCLVRDGDRYRAVDDRVRAVSGPEALAACDVGPDGALWTGDNLFGGSQVRRLDGDQVVAVHLGQGFPEAMAIGPGDRDGDVIVYRFSDTGRAPSRANRYRCTTKSARTAGAE